MKCRVKLGDLVDTYVVFRDWTECYRNCYLDCPLVRWFEKKGVCCTAGGRQVPYRRDNTYVQEQSQKTNLSWAES